MGKLIPDRWLNYQPIGQRVPSTRFIAFKVPLNRNINNTVDEELRLAPHSLLESVPNLGLIVDLTNTNRYYNPQAFKDKNVNHQKLMIPGHHTPSRELAQRFCDYVTEFLEANADNDKLIGVHCTHGVNRTGYLICYFMITKMNMPAKLAIQTFADARGHKIERENYTSSLLQLMKLDKEEHTSSNRSQDKAKKSKLIEQDQDQWPRQYHKKQDEHQDERRESSWRQEPSIWQEYEQQQLQKQHQRQERYDRYNQDRNQGYDERRPHRPQRQYQDNNSQRQEYYNSSYNQRQENFQTQSWRDDYQSYSRGNNYKNNSNNYRHNYSPYYSNGHNYSRNNNYGNNIYSRNNNYNADQERRTSHNRYKRFHDEEKAFI